VKKFEDLRYVERIDKYGKTLGLHMPGGFFVFAWTMSLAWACVNKNWPNIDWTRRQSAETLIGSDIWQAQVNGAKKALGRCIKCFAQHDMLPIRLVLARTRSGKPYKGGKRLYVPANAANAVAVPVMEIPAIRTARNRELLAHVDWVALQQPTPPIATGATHV
jgi:hypothetical protein